VVFGRCRGAAIMVVCVSPTASATSTVETRAIIETFPTLGMAGGRTRGGRSRDIRVSAAVALRQK